MPLYDSPLQGISYSAALQEAYAHAPAAQPPITTLAFYHASFVDDAGLPTALYVVNQVAPFSATLEIDAPLHAGEVVEFQVAPFEYIPPKESDEAKAPEIKIKINNLTREIMQHVRHAARGDSAVTVMARTYFASDTSAPHELPIPIYYVSAISADLQSITATAGFGNLINERFPKASYTADLYPGLIQGG